MNSKNGRGMHTLTLSQKNKFKKLTNCLVVAGLMTSGSVALAEADQKPAKQNVHADIPTPNIIPDTVEDKWLKKWLSVTPDREPKPLKAGKDYGLDPKTGKFIFPMAAPENHSGQKFPGEFKDIDKQSFKKNVEVVGFYPNVASPFHAWNNIVDFDGKRYFYIHDRDYLTIMDTTDPANAKVVYREGGDWGPNGPAEDWDAHKVKNYWGALTIVHSEKYDNPILVASYEVGRYGLMQYKRKETKHVAEQRSYNSLKGFKVYEMKGPTPKDWKLIATRTTDYKHPDAPIGKQQGSGVQDVAVYNGGKYMIVSAAPDDSYALTEYPNYLWSGGYQIWDMSDPADPKFISQITVPGQVVDDPESVAAYLKNPRAGNRTSWMGSRMGLFMAKPLDDGGKIAFGAMGGLGLWSFDLSDPKHPKILDNVNTPPSFAGTEYDNVEVSQYDRTGYVFTNGYPMNRDCYEPYKDIWVVDAKDPEKMRVVTHLPRPTPPEGAKFTSFCQRGGNFGPKRSNAFGQPGEWKQGILPYSYYSAGVQLFDVKDPAKPKIAGYFVPPQADKDVLPEYTLRKGVFAMYTEYDRNIMWAFTENGVYALSSPLLGKPVKGVPKKTWPPKK